MSFSIMRIKTFIHCGIFIALFMSTRVCGADAEKYRELLKAYQGALGQVEASLNSHREHVLKVAAEKLEALSADYKASGNIGFHFEASNLLGKIREDQFFSVNSDKFMNPDLQNFCLELSRALDQGIEQARVKKHHIQNVMVTQLEGLVRDLEGAGESAVAALARAQQESILQDETYQQTEQAKAVQPAPAVVHRPPPTPIPLQAPDTPPMLEVGMVKKTISRHHGGLDYDDQAQNLQFTVKVRSRELVKEYAGLKVEVWAVGRHVTQKSNYKMLLTDTMEIPSLERGQTVEVDTKSVRNVYDNNKYAKFGHKFSDYVLRVTEKATGKELFSKVSSSRLEKNLRKLMQTSEGMEFDL